MRPGNFLATAVALAASFLPSFVKGQGPPYDPSPYAAEGYIQAATVNDVSDILSGGTLTINNLEVIIPKNLLVNTPSLTAVAWRELFDASGNLDLPLWPEVNWEAAIYANYIQGQYVAGIVYIFQQIANLNQGFISAIDYEKGEMRIGGDFSNPNTGVRVVINDPVGRFGIVHGDWPIWTADTEYPSIAASTGFPVCLPRVDPDVEDDPLCPKKNRPTDGNGRPASGFTFGRSPVPEGQPDPNIFVPLRVGDHIIYSGTLVKDPNSGERIIAAYTIDANLGIYTTPGTTPAYLRIEALQAGVNGNQRGEIAETRVEGYTTDQTATIEIFTIDVDPCTGEQSDRVWGSAVPRTVERKGQWRFRSQSTRLPPYAREVGARIVTGTVDTPNGIVAGRFVSPYPPDGYIFPELNIFGDNQLPHEFDLLPHLVAGSGPWLGGIPGVPQTETGPIVGQLSPWPGVIQPAAIQCPEVDPRVPVADAGGDFTVVSGAIVTLTGRIKNTNLELSEVEFSWSQTRGVDVGLNTGEGINATFRAPTVISLTALTFTLEVSNNAGSSKDEVVVNVNPAIADAITVEEVSWESGGGSGTLTVTASTNSAVSQLFMSATNPDISRTAMTSLGGQRFQSVVSIRPAPASVTISSSLGASVTLPVTDDFVPFTSTPNGNSTEPASESVAGKSATSEAPPSTATDGEVETESAEVPASATEGTTAESTSASAEA